MRTRGPVTELVSATPTLRTEHSFWVPTPPMLHNHGNYVCSLGQVVRWLGKQAEELGVDIFPATPAAGVLYSGGSDEAAADPHAHVIGIVTADAGIGKNGEPKDSFAPGMEIVGKQTLFAEGARGSCSEDVMARFNLRAGCDPQTFGLGIKEVWRVPEGRCKPGLIQHTLGWPLPTDVYGGSFLCEEEAGSAAAVWGGAARLSCSLSSPCADHMAPDLVLLGFAVGLDYKNPYLSPYEEFQRCAARRRGALPCFAASRSSSPAASRRFKHHPRIRAHIEGGECIQYGARVINEGGFQSIPKLTFPGGALIGCSAGARGVTEWVRRMAQYPRCVWQASSMSRRSRGRTRR